MWYFRLVISLLLISFISDDAYNYSGLSCERKCSQGYQERELKYVELQAAVVLLCYASNKYRNPVFFTAAGASYFNRNIIELLIYRVRQKDLPHFKRQLQTNKERYGKNTLICEQQI
jgi:hypothetical protein